MEPLIINGTTYVPANSVPTGSRAVVVVDRGWIFAAAAKAAYAAYAADAAADWQAINPPALLERLINL